MRSFFIIMFCLVALIPSGHGQWFGRVSNTVGNWTAMSDNAGVVFNNGNSVGGTWKGTNLIFGAGLWVGGLVDCPTCKKAPIALTVSFDPNSGASDFVGGSAIYDGDAADSSVDARNKYLPALSTNMESSLWPVRTAQGLGVYVDAIADRSSAGAPYLIGQQDIFTVYKNTDTTVRDLSNNTEVVPFFEIRTQMGFWGESLGRDVIVVRNQLIYLGTDTLLAPTIALAIDGDIGGGTAASNNAMRGFLDDGVQGCLFRGGPLTKPAPPLLGVYLLRGTSGTGKTDPGITTLRRWTIANDPVTSTKRYDFMTAPVTDVVDSGQTGDMRALLASTSPSRIVRGDTLYFDYAIGAVDPSGSLASDTSNIIALGRTITKLYHSGSLGTLDVPTRSVGSTQLGIFPNPVGEAATCRIVSSPEPIRTIEILNVLGVSVRSNVMADESSSATIDLAGLPPGLYVVRINGSNSTKLVKE